MSATVKKDLEVYDIPITTIRVLYLGRRRFEIGEYLLVTTSVDFGRISPVFCVINSSYNAEDMVRLMHNNEDMDLFDCAKGWSSYVNGYEVWHVVDDPNDVVFKVVGLVGDHECMRANFDSLNQSRVFARRSVGYPFDRVCVFASNKYVFGNRNMVCDFYYGPSGIIERSFGMSGCGCECPA